MNINFQGIRKILSETGQIMDYMMLAVEMIIAIKLALLGYHYESLWYPIATENVNIILSQKDNIMHINFSNISLEYIKGFAICIFYAFIYSVGTGIALIFFGFSSWRIYSIMQDTTKSLNT